MVGKGPCMHITGDEGFVKSQARAFMKPLPCFLFSSCQVLHGRRFRCYVIDATLAEFWFGSTYTFSFNGIVEREYSD